MEDTIVVLRFNDLGQARLALHELKRLDRDRRLQVSAAALVGRSNDGRIAGSEDTEGYYLPKDGIVGMMVDALSGPTRAVFGRPTESFRGHGAPATHEAERELVLGEVSQNLEAGVTIVIAEISDPDPGVLDAELAALGGSVTRRAADDVSPSSKGDERRYRGSPLRNGRTRRRHNSVAVAIGTMNPSSQKATALST